MKPGPITDPELLGLLREISSDPKSRLMKLATQGLDARAQGHEPTISGGEPFLTRVERHLLREHRQHAAQLLLVQAMRELLDVPASDSLILERVSQGHQPQIPSRAWTEEQVERAMAFEGPDPAAASELGFFFGTREIDRSVALEAARASMRLDPRDEARIVLAVIMQQEAIEGWMPLLSEVQRAGKTRFHRSLAIQNASAEFLRRGELGRATEGFRVASTSGDSRPEPWLGLWISALLSRETEVVREASAQLAGFPAEDLRACVASASSIWNARSRQGLVAPAEVKGQVARIESELPDVLQPLALAFTRVE